MANHNPYELERVSMLDIPEHIAYDIIRRDNIPTIEVCEHKETQHKRTKNTRVRL